MHSREYSYCLPIWVNYLYPIIRTGRGWGANHSSGEGIWSTLVCLMDIKLFLSSFEIFLCLSCELQISIFLLVMPSLHGCLQCKSKTVIKFWHTTTHTHTHTNISLTVFHIFVNEPPSTQLNQPHSMFNWFLSPMYFSTCLSSLSPLHIHHHPSLRHDFLWPWPLSWLPNWCPPWSFASLQYILHSPVT